MISRCLYSKKRDPLYNSAILYLTYTRLDISFTMKFCIALRPRNANRWHEDILSKWFERIGLIQSQIAKTENLSRFVGQL